MRAPPDIYPYHTARGCAALIVEEVELPGPFWQWFEQYQQHEYGFLLDSARMLPGIAGHSFLGCAPWLVYTARSAGQGARFGQADIELAYFDGDRPAVSSRVERRRADPFADLSGLLAELQLPVALRQVLPLPFVGGAVGYVSYDAARFIERLPARAERDLDLPELVLMFVDQVLARDHATGRTYLATTGRGEDARAALAAAQRQSERYRTGIAAGSQRPAAGSGGSVRPAAGELRGYVSESDYAAVVECARQQILAGDAFEICTTHRLHAEYSGGAWDLYRSLRAVNPAPFACYLQLPELQLVSSSPERFLKLTRAREVEARPIKGTRPRGATPELDAQLREELASSEKERAENIMITDLLRNDLGRVCEVDSIHVPELMFVEEHPTLFQMISTIRGRLSESYTAADLLRACFPPGSMTGAPKIEAMKIIDALEPYRRGLYSGCVGYFDLGGGMDWSVVIRSFVVHAGQCYVGVGGAVVADSDPRGEYCESMDKARALQHALASVAGRAP